MKKASILLTLLVSGCTFVWGESDPEPSPRPRTTPDAGMQGGEAGAAQGAAGTPGEAGAGAELPGGAGGVATGGQGGAGEAMGGQGGGQGGAPAIVEGLGEACEDSSTCLESAPACPAAAGFCTFYCDEAWVNGWREVPSRVARCVAQGGECTPIGDERSYCVP